MSAPREGESGAVLLMVLVALALLAAVAAAAARLSASAIMATRAEAAVLRDQLTVPSLLALVAARMSGPDPLPVDGRAVTVTLPQGVVEVRLWAVSGLVNPETAPRPLLVALFRAADADPRLAEGLADRIISARTDAASSGEGRRFRLRPDLRRLLMDQPELWRRVRPMTTFLGANVNFDPATAPSALRAVAPPAALGSLDLYAGSAAQAASRFYELDYRSLEPARKGVTRISVSFDAGSYLVVSLGWPEDDDGDGKGTDVP